MERKTGEIFEHEGEWYQCVKNQRITCCDCDFYNDTVMDDGKIVGAECDTMVVGDCSGYFRKDGVYVKFKKLEKFGVPYKRNRKIYQLYNTPLPVDISSSDKINQIVRHDMIEIEQEKENMEQEKELQIPEGYEFDRAEDGKIFLKKREMSLQDMDDYHKCYSFMLDSKGISNVGMNTYIPKGMSNAVDALCRLLVCRNVWWKLLEYNPDWNNREEMKHCIHDDRGFITVTTHSSFPRILAFPDYHTAKEFKETFGDLIEKAKELL